MALNPIKKEEAPVQAIEGMVVPATTEGAATDAFAEFNTATEVKEEKGATPKERKPRTQKLFDDPNDDFPTLKVASSGTKNAAARTPVSVPTIELVMAAAEKAGFKVTKFLTSRGHLVGDITVQKGESPVVRMRIVADKDNFSRVSRYLYAVGNDACPASLQNKGLKTAMPAYIAPALKIDDDADAVVNLTNIIADLRLIMKVDAANGKYDRVIDVAAEPTTDAPIAE